MEKAIYLILTVALASFLSLFPDNALCKANDAMRVSGNNMLHNNKGNIYTSKGDIEEHANVKTGETTAQIHSHHVVDLATVDIFSSNIEIR